MEAHSRKAKVGILQGVLMYTFNFLLMQCTAAGQLIPGAPQVGRTSQTLMAVPLLTLLYSEFSSNELKSVGNYALGRLIGKGSFGKVYLATHKLTNGSKVVLKSANKTDQNLAREIHHHRQFVHPHIARLYEVIVTENLVWLALEYCSGMACRAARKKIVANGICRFRTLQLPSRPRTSPRR